MSLHLICFHLKQTLQKNVRSNKQFCSKLGKYRMPFAWSVRLVLDLETTRRQPESTLQHSNLLLLVPYVLFMFPGWCSRTTMGLWTASPDSLLYSNKKATRSPQKTWWSWSQSTGGTFSLEYLVHIKLNKQWTYQYLKRTLVCQLKSRLLYLYYIVFDQGWEDQQTADHSWQSGHYAGLCPTGTSQYVCVLCLGFLFMWVTMFLFCQLL